MSKKVTGETLRILRYIRFHGPVSYKACIAIFGTESSSRIQKLFDNKLIENSYEPAENGFSSKLRGLVVTDAGKNELIDAFWDSIYQIRSSAVIPIIVTIITSIVVDYAIPFVLARFQ